MKKIIFNFYLLVVLGLVAQAIFVVFSSNSTITDSLKVKQIQAENSKINNRIGVLEDKIASSLAINNLTPQSGKIAYVSIDKREIVAKKTLTAELN